MLIQIGKIQKIHLSTAFLLLALVFCADVIGSLTDVPVPDSARVSWVSPQLHHNGLDMAVQSFESDESVESVLSFYRSLWFGNESTRNYLEASFGEWSIISNTDRGVHTVLQLRTNGDPAYASGFLSQTLISANSVVTTPLSRPGFDVPGSMVLVSSTHSSELSKSSSTNIYVSTEKTSALARELERSMKNKGWTVQNANELDSVHILMFSKKDKYVELAITQGDDGNSIVFTNEVNSHE